MKVSVEVHSETARFAVAVKARNVQQALNVAAARYPDSVAEVRFPIEPEGFFVEHPAVEGSAAWVEPVEPVTDQ